MALFNPNSPLASKCSYWPRTAPLPLNSILVLTMSICPKQVPHLCGPQNQWLSRNCDPPNLPPQKQCPLILEGPKWPLYPSKTVALIWGGGKWALGPLKNSGLKSLFYLSAILASHLTPYLSPFPHCLPKISGPRGVIKYKAFWTWIVLFWPYQTMTPQHVE